jgi:hypothetical protein
MLSSNDERGRAFAICSIPIPKQGVMRFSSSTPPECRELDIEELLLAMQAKLALLLTVVDQKKTNRTKTVLHEEPTKSHKKALKFW